MMNPSKNAFVISAPCSGTGKTMATLFLAAYFKNKGKKIQCFKSGPDYIDNILHRKITGRPTINLDAVMMPENHIKTIFEKYHSGADCSIVEGMMGLFDGVPKSYGSTAHLSKILGLPVVLVVSARGVGFGVAALLKGFLNYDKDLKIIGVIFNHVGSDKHKNLLSDACKELCVRCMGFLPFDTSLKIPSRHLGLVTEHKKTQDNLKIFLERSEKTALIDTDTLLEKTKFHAPIQKQTPLKNTLKKRIAIARDKAFYFYYEENLKALETLGSLCFFSPLNDSKIPECDFIYIGGGYPEHHLETLSKNIPLQKSLRDRAEKGVKIWAECGGMMLLGKNIIAPNKKKYPMVNIFNFETDMQKTRLQIGYRKWAFGKNTFWGHEFHYSTLQMNTPEKTMGRVVDIRGKTTATKVFRYKNTIASYLHLYWGDDPSKMMAFF